MKSINNTNKNWFEFNQVITFDPSVIKIIASVRIFSIGVAILLIATALTLCFFTPAEMTILLNQSGYLFWDNLFTFFTLFGDALIIILVIVTTLFVSKRMVLVSVVAFSVGGLISSLFKQVLMNGWPRPDLYLGHGKLRMILDAPLLQQNSFPSGHTLTAFTGFVLLAFMFNKPTFQFLFFMLALITGISRLYLGQHFLHDVAAGAFIGYFIAIVTIALIYKITNSKLNSPIIHLNAKRKS